MVGLDKAKKLLTDLPNKITSHLGIVVEVNLHVTTKGDFLEIVVEQQPNPVNLELLLCRENVWNGCHALTVNFMGVWPPAIALQEEIANRCMLLIRKRIGSERYI